MNLSFVKSSTSRLTWHLLVETLEQGQVSAWVAEFPECRVVAESEEVAMVDLEAMLNQRMATIKVLPFKLLPSKSSENPWHKLAGSLKDDESFVEWSDRFWAEKQQDLEEDEILSVEECLRAM